jgi:hypothetical protein
MAFGFPAYAVDTRSLNLERDRLVHVVSETLTRLGWDYQNLLPSHFTVNVPPSWTSWGERMTITVNADGNISAKSESRLVTQCLDWGKNQENIDIFFNHLSQIANPLILQRSSRNNDGITPVQRLFND